MKRIFTLLFTLTISYIAYNQTSTVVFSESFDAPSLGDSVTATANSASGWYEFSGLSVSPNNSFRDSIGSGDTSWVTTDVFDCSGNTFVLLEFDQICKIAFFDAAIVEYSTDGGSTWDKLTAIDLTTQDTIYLGSGNFGTSGNKFASNSYFDWLPANSSAIPTSSWWKHETFNLSTYFANESNCRIRFTLMDQNFQGSADYGWLIDNIKVTAAPSEIIPPSLNIQLPYPLGNITASGPFPVVYKSYDASGIDSVVLYYQVNGGLWDSIYLSNTSGNFWSDSIPTVTTDDTVCYYAMAWDGSPAHNSTREPDTGTYCFTPIPVPPVVILGTGTNTNSNTAYPAPYGALNKRAKTQMLVTAAELQAEGLTGPLEMKSLAFHVAAPAGSDLEDFYIKMGNFQGNFTGFLNTGLSTYYTNSSYSSNNGWNEHMFSQPFIWDGVSDIVIETCFDIPGTGTETSNARHYYTTYPGTMVVYYQSSFSSTVCTSPPFSYTSGSRPNMRIGLGDPLGIDPGLIKVVSPVDGGCSLSSSESIKLEYANFGLDTLDYLPFGYILNGAAPVYDTLWSTIYPSDTAIFTFSGTLDLSGAGQFYDFTFFTHMDGDLGYYNDTISNYGIQNTTQNTPYQEDFDSFSSGTQLTQGFWEQATNDDNDWWFDNVQTSTGSSPYADHTTGVSGQGNYAYFNATWPWGHEAVLISPCIDLQNMNAPKLNFWYHMFGPNVGSLYVDVLGVNGTWTNLWNDSGSTAVRQWYEQTLNLSGYSGDIVKVRFRAVHATLNGGYNGDICIDDIFVFEPSDYDVAVAEVSAPTDGYCSYSSSEDLTVDIVNFGLQSLTNVSVSYQVNGGSTVTETIAGPIPAGDTVSYTFNTTVDMSTSSQGYDFLIWSNHASDTLPYNDTSTAYVFHEPMISGFPFTQDFENFTASTFFNDPGIMNEYWRRTPLDSPAVSFMWFVKSGYTNTTNTGPSGDHTFGPGQTMGKYLHIEPNYGIMGDMASLISPCVDFSNLDFPFVEFYIHRYSISAAFDAFGPLIIEVDDGSGWVVADTIEYQSPSPQQGYDDPWDRAVANLSAVAGGKIVKIRWRALQGSTNWADLCIDDITFYQPAPKDLAIIDVVEPTVLLMEGGQGTVSAVIFNYGRDTLYTSDIKYTVNGAQSTTETWSGVLYPNETDTFTFQTQFTAPGGLYDLCVIAQLAGDTIQYNDTVCENRTGIEVFTVPYFNDFENGASSWVVDGGFLQWELDTPSASIINTAYSGSLAWCTNCDGMYLDNSFDYLYTPFFDLAGNIENSLKFANLFHFENINDGGYVEYSTDGGASWDQLGTYQDTLNATWWYNLANLNNLGIPGFNNTNYPWQISTYDLSFLNGETTPIQFRFVFRTNQFVNFFNGWAIDDFEIITPDQNSGSGILVDVLPSNNFILPGPHSVRAKLQNTGVVDLSSVEVAYFIDNPPVLANDPVNITAPLVYEDTISHLFSAQWNATSGTHTVCAYTHTPNDTVDANFSDDTVCVEVVVFDTFDASDPSFSYCNDFEGGQNPLVGLNAFTYDTTGSWERGLPQNVYINGALSGDNCWVTGLSGDYFDKDSSAFYSPVLDVNNTDCYKISFYHKFLTEAYQDGGIVEYSNDLGLTWNIIGDYGYPNWYNAQFVTALAPVTPGLPGFTGIQTTWELAEIDFKFPSSGPVIVRWRFASDYSVTDEGWAIDDICIDNIGLCSPTTIEEKPELAGIAVYPNPNQGQFVLNIESLTDAQVEVEIFDMLGKQIYYSLEETMVGVNKLPFDLSGIESGVYMVKVRSGSRELSDRLIISH